MFENVYLNPNAKGEDKAVHMIEQLRILCRTYRSPSRIFKEALVFSDEKEQIICDYIAGMTDSYAVKKIPGLFYCPKHGKFKIKGNQKVLSNIIYRTIFYGG